MAWWQHPQRTVAWLLPATDRGIVTWHMAAPPWQCNAGRMASHRRASRGEIPLLSPTGTLLCAGSRSEATKGCTVCMYAPVALAPVDALSWLGSCCVAAACGALRAGFGEDGFIPLGHMANVVPPCTHVLTCMHTCW